jgi:hypothetical protein
MADAGGITRFSVFALSVNQATRGSSLAAMPSEISFSFMYLIKRDQQPSCTIGFAFGP